jgi:hypothetical protein
VCGYIEPDICVVRRLERLFIDKYVQIRETIENNL